MPKPASRQRLPSSWRRLARPGIVPTLLAASLLAVVIAVTVVQSWTVHIVSQSQAQAVQAQLDIDLAVLKSVLLQQGRDWRLRDDGTLMLDGKPAGGLDTEVDAVSRITHAVATIFVADTRLATTVTRPDGSRATGTALAPGAARDAVIGQGKAFRGYTDILGVSHFTVYEPWRDAAGRQIGILFVGVPSTSVQAMLNTILWQTCVAALSVTLLVGLSLWLMLRTTLRPLQALAGAVKTISDGHLDIAVPCADRTDQLGEIGRAVDMLRTKAKQAHVLETQASANQRLKARRQAALDQITHEFATSVTAVMARLVASAEGMRGSAAEMAEAAEQTRGDMASTTADAGHSAQNLATVAAAAEQLTASVSEISRQVEQAAQAAREAVMQAQATDATVHSLSEAAGQIGQVVSLINNIAAQTNLLALNATIEAARAGEAGKGFAVVAGEVKQLATQTAQATQQIGVQVSAIQHATNDAAIAVRGATEAIGRVSNVATVIAAAVEQQGAATLEIAAQVNVVAKATGKATHAMHGVSAAAEKSSLASQSVLVTADQVTQISASLRDDVDQFVIAMHASQESSERRGHERLPGVDTTAKLRCDAFGAMEVPVIDISVGGAALACDWPCQAGTAITLGLPGGGSDVSAQVTGVRNGVLAVTFAQDRATLGRVTQAVDWIAAKAAAGQRQAAA